MNQEQRRDRKSRAGPVSDEALEVGQSCLLVRTAGGLPQTAFLGKGAKGLASASTVSEFENGRIEKYEQKADELLSSVGLDRSDLEEARALYRRVRAKVARHKSQGSSAAEGEVRDVNALEYQVDPRFRAEVDAVKETVRSAADAVVEAGFARLDDIHRTLEALLKLVNGALAARKKEAG